MRPKTKTLQLSIGLPVYNGEQYLPRTFDSLLAQTYGDFELIVSDNASTDATEEICRDYAGRDSRIHYHRSDFNRGAAWNFNTAFRLSRGKYFKWAAHDDLHAPTFLEKCIDVLDHDPTVVLCFTRITFIDGSGQDLGEYEFPVDISTASRRDLFRVYAAAGHINCEIFGVFRAASLRKTPLIGSYVGSDLVLMGKVVLQGRFHQVQETLFLHREYEGRSTRATGGTQGYTQWFDSSKSGRYAAPFWRRIVENSKSLLLAPIPTREKLVCLWDLARTANWNRQAYLEDLRRVVKPKGGIRP